MKALTGVACFVLLHILVFFPHSAHAARQTDNDHRAAVEWTSREAQHVYGLPDAKAKDKGSLTLSGTDLSFIGKAGSGSIPRRSILAVSAGNQRVEIWGMKGRVLRMVIPDGGGVVAAMFMHHRVDMLTVEFTDPRGGYHGAVFFLPAEEASSALESFSRTPVVAPEFQSRACQDGFVRPHSVLLSAPTWDQVQVPAVYRALVYERLLEGLRQVQGVDHVYRDGENTARKGCPEYTMQLSISGFKEGNQVKRAVLGPAGFFVSTTQMRFEASVTDGSGRVSMQEQTKATVRGETESTNVSEDVARELAKHFAAVLKKSGENIAASTAAPRH
jgi:hypothetical protein